MRRLGYVVVVAAVLGWIVGINPASAASPLLLRDPSISRTQIAFAYGGAIWIVPRAGGDARRLVTGSDLLGGPIFSPDGTQLAYTGNYDGHSDVYVVPALGGEPRRLTYNPQANVAVGWTPDGKDVLFRSSIASTNDPHQLYTVPLAGGFPTRLPLPMAETGSYSPDAKRIAYVPNFRWEPFWQGYRGGQTSRVYLTDLADSHTVRLSNENANDDDPMWIDTTIYFLSDRNGPTTLFAYDTQSHAVTRVLPAEGFDITSASAGPDAIVYASFDTLHVYDLRAHAAHAVDVRIAADMPQLRPRWENVGGRITNATISPAGARAAFEAHGAIFSVPAENGAIRNISDAPHVENRDPEWSPDGQSIAFFSDRSGEYKLYVRDQNALTAPRVIDLGPTPSFFYHPVWSPDSKKIAYTDKRGNLWYLDLEHATPVKITTDRTGNPYLSASWSPDSRWIAYDLTLPNRLRAIFVYALADATSHQITDGLSDARHPAFDRGGKYLSFTASTNAGPSSYGLDMTSDDHPTTSFVYLAVLGRDTLSPLAPKSDDEKATPSPSPSPSSPATGPSPREVPPVRIDFEAIGQRIVALPTVEAPYVNLAPGKTGSLFLVRRPTGAIGPAQRLLDVEMFDLTTRKTTPFANGLGAFRLSANGEKALYLQRGRWYIAPADKPPPATTQPLATPDMELFVDPHAEWDHMYHEVWRIERDWFYDPHYHGLDLAATEKRFAAYLPGIAARDDLTFLFREMLSYLSVGHMFVNGGTEPDVQRVNVGLLGADYRLENGRYRFAKIYDGENWNPQLHAPLTEPGTNVHVGDYLLAVNGHPLTSRENIFAAFQETAGKQVVLSIGPNADGAGARDVSAIPLASEDALRNYAWIEDNRRKVDALSGGKLAYVYLPDTAANGYANFNRYFFAQVGKQGVILDERFNHGGQIADYVIDYLSRKPMSLVVPRDGPPFVDPPLAIYGPKVMIVNEFAGSGGDALPWYFRKANLGPLVGTRTWGGLVGIGGYPVLMDGGSVTAPHLAIGGLNGQWEVEGHGIAPDVEVWQDPELVRAGHDPQLEAAVKKALELLRDHPVPTYKVPPYPDRQPKLRP